MKRRCRLSADSLNPGTAYVPTDPVGYGNPVTDRKGVDHRTGICRQVETGAERLSEEEGGR